MPTNKHFIKERRRIYKALPSQYFVTTFMLLMWELVGVIPFTLHTTTFDKGCYIIKAWQGRWSLMHTCVHTQCGWWASYLEKGFKLTCSTINEKWLEWEKDEEDDSSSRNDKSEEIHTHTKRDLRSILHSLDSFWTPMAIRSLSLAAIFPCI